MTQNNPHISVCIPVYNGAEFLERCFNSISAQTFRNFEVVISDNGSSDASLSLAKNFQQNVDFEVRVVQNPRKGLAENWNYCIKQAKGTFIKFLFQDDTLEPDCLSKLNQHTEQSDFIYCQRNFLIKDTNQPFFKEWLAEYADLHGAWKKPPEEFGSGQEFLQSTTEIFSYPLNKIGEPTSTLIRKSIFDKTGHFDESLQQLTDVEMYYRIIRYARVAYIHEKLVNIGLHRNQTTQSNEVLGKSDEDLALYDRLKKNPEIHWKRINDIFPIKYRVKKQIKKWLGRA